MPSRAFRILFGKLPHALSAAIQRSTRRIHTRVRQHRPAKVRLRMYAAMGETSTNHEAHPTRTGAMHHGALMHGYWWLSPAIDVRASGCTHATCISMVSARDRCTDPQPPLAISDARRRERYYPVMDAPSVRRREYLARRNHVDETPPSTPDDLAATQLNAPQRACGPTSSVASHSSLEERLCRSTPSEKRALQSEASIDWCGL